MLSGITGTRGERVEEDAGGSTISSQRPLVFPHTPPRRCFDTGAAGVFMLSLPSRP